MHHFVLSLIKTSSCNESLAANPTDSPSGKKLKEFAYWFFAEFAKLTNEYADDAVVSMLATEAIL